jgi:type VI secretion system secreted protein VgrG
MTHQYLNEAAADIATLSGCGKAWQLNGLLRLSFPLDEGSYFGQAGAWPKVAPPEAGAAEPSAPAPTGQNPELPAGANAAAGNLNGAAGKFGAIAQAAQQAASAVQALPKGGAQGLLAPLAQTALGNIAGKLTGGPSSLGVPGSLPSTGTDVTPAPLQQSVL